MKTRNANIKLIILSLEIVGVMSSIQVYADDEELVTLKYPTNTVEINGISLDKKSQKFGEYNGFNKQGIYLNGNFNFRGGDAYKSNELGATDRWSFTATDIGLSNRSASFGYSDQGNWGVTVGYDALVHNLAPGYQTIYQGSMGGNNFTLPSSVGFPMVTTTPGTTSLTATQLSAFRSVDISSTRQNSSLTATKIIDNQFSLNVDFNHLAQTGAKLMGFAQAAVAGTTGTPTSQAVAILPNPTNYQTDTINVAANWLGEKGRLTTAYSASFFKDGFSQVNWNTWAGASGVSNSQTMSTAPSNQFHQINLNGGYDFSAKTKLTGAFSFGRNMQSSASGYDSAMIVSGAPTPPGYKGVINNIHADLKVVDRTVQNLNMSMSYKYDSRIDLSQSNIQQLLAVNGVDPTAYPNTPMSYRKGRLDLSGEYKLDAI